jgi:type I restriction enzyme M protein
MLDSETKGRINTARDILVGKVPDPKSQVEQITIALIYKFMDDMDLQSEELGGERSFFKGEFEKYAWRKIFDPRMGGFEILNLYSEAIMKMNVNPNIPQLFRDIFKNAYLPYRDPETLKAFLKIINEFTYDHSERLGDAFEFLLSILGSQGEAGQFRTPRHIIDFMVAIIDPKKEEVILDPACGTAGFLISSYKHIIKLNSSNYDPKADTRMFETKDLSLSEIVINSKNYKGDKLTPDERNRLANNIKGYDISPDMVRLSLVNMYLHGLHAPHIYEYDTLTSEDNWNEYADVILANPPFMSPKGGIRPHKRFSITSNRSEVLFVDYIAEHLTPNGRAVVIVPEGIIFQSGTAYKNLRKMLVENYLVGVISLPAGVFNPYSGVKTSILWLDRTLAKKTDKILFVKIENDGFDLGAQRRAIKKNDLPDAANIISDYKNQILTGKLADFKSVSNISIVSRNDISDSGDYNLSGERYRNKDSLSSYELVNLNDVCEFEYGFTASAKDTGDTRFVRITDIDKNGTISEKGKKFINLNAENKKYLLSKGDIIIARTGATFGKTAIYEGNEPAIFASFLIRIRVNPDLLIPKFLWALTWSDKYWDQARRLVTGGGQPQFNANVIKRIQIPLHPLPVQKEIVAEIESYQKIIDGARQVVENYKPRIDIDPEWPMVELSKVVKLSSGSFLTAHDMVDGPYPVFGGNGINGYHNKYNQENPTIVVGRVGAYCGSIHISEPKSWITDNALFVTDLMREVDLNYLAQIFKQLNFNQYAKVGGQPSISQRTITELKAPIPPIEVQRIWIAKIDHEENIIKVNRELIEMFEQKIKDRIAKVWGE